MLCVFIKQFQCLDWRLTTSLSLSLSHSFSLCECLIAACRPICLCLSSPSVLVSTLVSFPHFLRFSGENVKAAAEVLRRFQVNQRNTKYLEIVIFFIKLTFLSASNKNSAIKTFLFYESLFKTFELMEIFYF